MQQTTIISTSVLWIILTNVDAQVDRGMCFCFVFVLGNSDCITEIPWRFSVTLFLGKVLGSTN